MKIKKSTFEIGMLFPFKMDVVNDDFDYLEYLISAHNFIKHNICEGVFENSAHRGEGSNTKRLHSDHVDDVISSEYRDPCPEELVKRMGDLDNDEYQKEIKLLQQEFKQRITNGEDVQEVNIDITERMKELATRNKDGSHTCQKTK